MCLHINSRDIGQGKKNEQRLNEDIGEKEI